MSISISNTVAAPIVNSATASKVVSNTPSSVGVTQTAAKAAPSAIVALSKTASGASTTQTYSISDVLNMDTSKMSAVSISDAAESFSTNFAGLKALNDAKKIGSISLFQPATLTLDQSEVPDLSSKTSSSNSLLNKISSSYKLNLTGFAASDALAVTKPTSASSLTIKVTDTADNISANFAKLAKSSTVTQITSQNPDMALTVSAADYLANKDSFALKYSGAKFNLTNVTTDQIPTLNADTNVVGLNIADTGANVVTNLSAMQSAGTKVQSINVSDSKMSMDVATATNATNAAFLKNANFTGAIAVTVTGVTSTTGNSDLGAVAQDAFNKTSANQNLTTTIRISDTAAHIQDALPALDLMNSLNPGSIARVDVKDGGVLDFSNSDNFKLSSDLMKSFGKGYTLKIDSITAAEAVTFVPPTPGLTVQMTVQDSASNISANLDALAKTKSISAIVVQGGQSIDLSAQQYRSYAGNTGALNTKFFKVYDSTTPANNVNAHFNVNGATAADAAKIFADTTSESPAVKRIDNVTISDTGANIMKNIADLKAFDATVKLSSLTVSDGKLSLQASDVLAGNASTGTFLQNAPLSGPVNVTISNVETADVATVTALGSNANLNITQNVKDTTSGISQDDLDTLKTQSLAGAKFGTITASTNAGTVNGFGKYSDDLDIISKLSGVSLTINNVTAAQALDPNFSKTRGSIKVVDTADNISANFDALMKSSNIKTIEASGGNSQAISISFAQFNQYKGSKADGSDGALMLKAGTSANGVVQKFNIADATAASVTGIKNYAAGGSQGAMINVISVKDTGANIAASMAALNTALSASKLGTINVTDGSISKTSADMTAHSNAFSNFVSNATFTAPVTLRVTGVAAAADAVSNNSNIHNANVTVVQDVKEAAGTSGAASITSDEVNALENAVASGVNFGKIDVTNSASTDVVDFTDMAQFNRSADIVSKLVPTAKIKIESVSAADALTLTDPKFNLVVKDSAANISSNFAALMQQGSVKTVVADFGDAITVSATDFVKFKGTTDTGTIAKQGGGTTNSAIKDKMATSANGDVQTFNITDAKANMVGASGTANSFLAFNASDATGHAAGDMIKSISVTDTGANIAANISALSAASTTLSTVNATDGKLSLSEADTVTYTSFLGSDKFANALTLTVKDVDTAQHAIDNNGIEGKNSNISVVQNYKASDNLTTTVVDDLMNAEAVGAIIDKITLGGTTNKASFTDMAQFNRSQAIVSQLAAGSKISIGSATVAEALDPKFQNKNFEFTIKDSAANISASFDKLMTNNNVTHVSADFSDAISITATQFNRYKGTADAGTSGAILSKLVNSSRDYQKLDIKDALASQVSEASSAGNILAFSAGSNIAGSMINSVSVKDTGAHVFASIGTTTSSSETLLSKASAANKLTTIEVTDGKMTLASTDVYTSGSALNGKGTFLQNVTFKNPVTISVSDVETADVGGVSGLTRNKNINLTQGVKDTTTDLSQDDLNSLEFALNSGTKLSSVSAPGEAVNVTNIDSYNNVKDVIAKLSGNPTIKFGSVTVAQALDPAFSGKKVEFTVKDTAANISANIDQLMATKTVTQVVDTDQYKTLLGDVKAASTGNVAGAFAAGVITAAGNGALGAIDGVTLGSAGRVLLKDQTDKAQNGIYTVTTVGDSTHAYVLTRATDANSAGPTALALGNGAMVKGGATNIGQIFKITTTDTITPGTTALTFAAEQKISLTADQYNRYIASTDLKTKFITNPGLTSATGPAFDVQGLRADQVVAALGGHGNDIFVASASIKDTGANIMAKLSDIQTISPRSGSSAMGALTGVTVTDGQLNLTEAQVKHPPTSSTWTAATTTSVLLNAQFKSGTGEPVTLNVTGVHAGNVTQIANNVSKTNGYKLQFNIVDNAVDLSAAMTPVTLNAHFAVVAASTANITGTYDYTAKTITGASSVALVAVDGVTLAGNDRVLLKDQTDATQNGVYKVSDDGSGSNPYQLTRVTDFNAASAGSIETGATFTVSGGTTNVNKTFGLSTKAPVLGSTAAASSALTFVDQNDPAAAAIYSANTVGDGSKLTSGLIKSIKIDPTPTSAAPSTITLRNYADFMNNYDALKSIKENFTLQIGGISSSNGSGTRLNSTGGVSIAEYKAIAAKTLGANVNLQVVIKDAGSAITSPDNLDLLNSMVKAGKIVNVGTDGTRINTGSTNALDGIQVSSTSRQINLTAAQLGKYQAVAKALAVDANANSRYVLNVTAAKATDVSRMVSDANYGSQIQNISIIDTRASIAGSVNSLAANSAKISSIALDPTDSTNPNPQMSVNDAKNLFGNVAAMAGVVNFQYNLIDSIAALNTQVETSATEKTVSRAANISVTDNLTVQLNATDMAAYNTYKDRITGNQPVVVGS